MRSRCFVAARFARAVHLRAWCPAPAPRRTRCRTFHTGIRWNDNETTCWRIPCVGQAASFSRAPRNYTHERIALYIRFLPILPRHAPVPQTSARTALTTPEWPAGQCASSRVRTVSSARMIQTGFPSADEKSTVCVWFSIDSVNSVRRWGKGRLNPWMGRRATPAPDQGLQADRGQNADL
jgi:hypothetical protein